MNYYYTRFVYGKYIERNEGYIPKERFSNQINILKK